MYDKPRTPSDTFIRVMRVAVLLLYAVALIEIFQWLVYYRLAADAEAQVATAAVEDVAGASRAWARFAAYAPHWFDPIRTAALGLFLHGLLKWLTEREDQALVSDRSEAGVS